MALPQKKKKKKKREKIYILVQFLSHCKGVRIAVCPWPEEDLRHRILDLHHPGITSLVVSKNQNECQRTKCPHPPTPPPLIQTAVAHFIKREERAEAALVDLKTKFDLDTLSLFSSLYRSIPNSTRITSITTPTHPPTYSTTVPHPSEMALFTVHYKVWIQGSSAWALGWSWQPGRNWGRLGKKASICNSPPNKIISSPGDWQPSKDPPNSQAGPQKGARSHIVFTL